MSDDDDDEDEFLEPLHNAENLCISELSNYAPSGKKVTEFKLKALFRSKGEFPTKHRTLIWRYLLKLPENTQSFSDLVRRGIHPAYAKLNEKYPLRSRRIYARLQNVCSQLAHWAPILAESHWLPQLVFPFVMVFGGDELACLEACMTVVCWWGSTWHATHPNPPIHIVDTLDALIKKAEPRLHNSLVTSYHVAPGLMGWIMLSSLFTEVLTRQDWCKLMDLLFLNFGRSNGRQILLVPVAMFITLKPVLGKCRSKQEILDCLRSQNKSFDFKVMAKALASLTKNTNPNALVSMPGPEGYNNQANHNNNAGSTNGGSTAGGDDDLSSVGSNATMGSKSSGARGRDRDRGLTEEEEARACLALSSGRPHFPLSRGSYPVMAGYPTNVVQDWQLRDRHQAMSHSNVGSLGLQREDVLSSLFTRVDHIEAEHAEYLQLAHDHSQNERGRKEQQIGRETELLGELQRIEEDIATAKGQAAIAQEKSIKESLRNLDFAADSAMQDISQSERLMDQKVALQLEIAKSREVGEKAEASTQAKVETLLQARVREEWVKGLTSTADAREREIKASIGLDEERARMEEDELALREEMRQRKRLHVSKSIGLSVMDVEGHIYFSILVFWWYLVSYGVLH